MARRGNSGSSQTRVRHHRQAHADMSGRQSKEQSVGQTGGYGEELIANSNLVILHGERPAARNRYLCPVDYGLLYVGYIL